MKRVFLRPLEGKTSFSNSEIPNPTLTYSGLLPCANAPNQEGIFVLNLSYFTGLTSLSTSVTYIVFIKTISAASAFPLTVAQWGNGSCFMSEAHTDIERNTHQIYMPRIMSPQNRLKKQNTLSTDAFHYNRKLMVLWFPRIIGKH